MSWWYVSCPRFSCLVELDDNNVIVGGAPIVRRFMGKPAKQLGEYMRKQGGRANKMPAPGEVRFERLKDPAAPGLAATSKAAEPSSTANGPREASSVGNGEGKGAAGYVWYVYVWGNNEKRATLKGRRCRIVARGTMRSVLVEFDNGERVVTSIRALRKENA